MDGLRLHFRQCSIAPRSLASWEAAAQLFSQETPIMCCIPPSAWRKNDSRHQRTVLGGGALSDGLRKYSNT